MSKLLRKCVRCGREAWNESDLKYFRKSKRSISGRDNRCNTCHYKRDPNPPYLRKCRMCGLEAKTEEELNVFLKGKNYPHGRINLCKKCSKERETPPKPYLRKCRVCGLEVYTKEDLDKFVTAKRYKFGKSGCCKKCQNDEQREYRSNDVFNTLVWTKKSECLRRKLPFNLDKEYLRNLWGRQHGLCALSGIKLSPPYSKSEFDLAASLDRIDCDKGYTKGNVRWVLNAVNMMKQKRGDDFVYWIVEAIVKHKDSKFIP